MHYLEKVHIAEQAKKYPGSYQAVSSSGGYCEKSLHEPKVCSLMSPPPPWTLR